MDIMMYVIACGATGVLGYVIGMWHGYVNSLPERDERGRFTPKD